jgi:DNA-binding NtrC family response regulator
MSRRASQPTILVADDTPANIEVLLKCLSQEGYRVLVAQDGESAVTQARYGRPDLILLDVMMPEIDGFEACRQLKADDETRDIPIIFMTVLDEIEDKVSAFELGAADYITKPFRYQEVMARVNTHLSLRRLQRELQEMNQALEQRVAARTADLTRANESLQQEIGQREQAERALKAALHEVKLLKDRLQNENVYLQEEIRSHGDPAVIVGGCAALRAVLDGVARVAPSSATVLIHGETGTGKELIARAIHDRSPRRERAMVKLNCAAISAGLVESELFGHVKGAFTSASDKRVGRFELADGGTLFLDEVSELPLDTQAKLLRVLQEQEFERVGSSTPIKVDVRIIAATNRDLRHEVAAGRFRADLFYRLNVFPLVVPPLRERAEDIPALIEHFLGTYARKHGKRMAGVAPETVQAMSAHPWPGNIRDLQNVIERAVILAGDEPILCIDLDGAPARVAATNAAPAVAAAETSSALPTLEEIERRHFLRALRHARGVIEGPNGAARILNLKPSTARFRMKKLGIRKEHYQS